MSAPTGRPEGEYRAQPEGTPTRRMVFSTRARADTFALWDDLASAGDRFGTGPVDPVESAEAFAERLRAACDRIRSDPGCGAPRDDLAPGLRSLALEDAVVFYRARDDEAQVVRVLAASEVD
jgi:plasmid stabilization system protein ParE